MPFVISAVLFVFWIAIAYREYERGDLLLAGAFALVGIVLTYVPDPSLAGEAVC